MRTRTASAPSAAARLAAATAARVDSRPVPTIIGRVPGIVSRAAAMTRSLSSSSSSAASPFEPSTTKPVSGDRIQRASAIRSRPASTSPRSSKGVGIGA